MNEYRDEGYGQTELSKKYVEEWIKTGLISNNKVKSILLSGPRDDYLVEIHTDNGLFYLSGFSWGYSGTGPHGLLWLFDKLGIPFSIKEIFGWKQSGIYKILKKKGKWEIIIKNSEG